MTPRERYRELLLAEWVRRGEQLAHDLEVARRRGDLAEYRRLRQRWQRFYADEHAEPPVA